MEIDETLIRRLLDEQAILRTLHAYGHAIDYGDEAAWVDGFTEDGVFHVKMPHGEAARRYAGRAELAAFVAQHSRAPEVLHKHLVLNAVIDVAGDEARCASYFNMLMEIGGMPETYCFGRYLDRLRRSPDGTWRFAERVAEVQSIRAGAPRPTAAKKAPRRSMKKPGRSGDTLWEGHNSPNAIMLSQTYI
jgi:hypothetical protein